MTYIGTNIEFSNNRKVCTLNHIIDIMEEIDIQKAFWFFCLLKTIGGKQ
jgi:hypothetical protein